MHPSFNLSDEQFNLLVNQHSQAMGVTEPTVRRLYQALPARDQSRSYKNFIRTGRTAPSVGFVMNNAAAQFERQVRVNRMIESLGHPGLFGPNPTARNPRLGLRRNSRDLQLMGIRFAIDEMTLEHPDYKLDPQMIAADYEFDGDLGEVKARLMVWAYERIQHNIVSSLIGLSAGSRHLAPDSPIIAQSDFLMQNIKLVFPMGFGKSAQSTTVQQARTEGLNATPIKALILNYAEYIADYLEKIYSDPDVTAGDEAPDITTEEGQMEFFESHFFEAFNQAEQEIAYDKPFRLDAFRGQIHANRLYRATDALKPEIRSLVPTEVHEHHGIGAHSERHRVYKQTLPDDIVQWLLPITNQTIYGYGHVRDSKKRKEARNRAVDKFIERAITGAFSRTFGYQLPQNTPLPDEICIPLLVNHHNSHWTSLVITVSLNEEAKGFFADNAGRLLECKDDGVPDRTQDIKNVLRNASIHVEHMESSPLVASGVNKDKTLRLGPSTPCESEISAAVSNARGRGFPNIRHTRFPVPQQVGTTCLDNALWNTYLRPLIEGPMPAHDSVALRGITDEPNPTVRVNLARNYFQRLGIQPSPALEESVSDVQVHSSVEPIADSDDHDAKHKEHESSPASVAATVPAAVPARAATPSLASVAATVPADVPPRAVTPSSASVATTVPAAVPPRAVTPSSASVAATVPADASARAATSSGPASVTATVPADPSARAAISAAEALIRKAAPQTSPSLTRRLPARSASPSESSNYSKVDSNISKNKKSWKRAEIQFALHMALENWRAKNQKLLGSRVSNVLWGIMTFLLMIFTLGIFHKPFVNHVRANQVERYIATSDPQERTKIAHKWGKVTNKASLLDESDAEVLTAAIQTTSSPKVAPLLRIREVALKSLKGAPETPGSIKCTRLAGLSMTRRNK